MFISNSKKFIFVHITKCAGTSVTQALLKYRSWNDLELGVSNIGNKLEGYYRKNYNLHKHSTAKDIKKTLGEEIWNKYFSFTFVRHPVSRTLSLYKFIERGVKSRKRKLLKFKQHKDPFWSWPLTKAYVGSKTISDFIRNPLFFEALGSKPQIHWLLDDNEEILVDFIGKFENLKDDFNIVCDKIGVKSVEIGSHNKSGSIDISLNEIFTDNDIEYLYDFYKRDFQTLGYEI